MQKLLHVNLADGVTAVLPLGWQFHAESSDNAQVFAVKMSNESCNAQFELLYNPSFDSKELISTYCFNLMQGLSSLGVTFIARDPKFPYEIQAIKEGVNGTIIHIFKPTQPVVHVNAIGQSLSDITELRLIADSITVNSNSFTLSGDEEIIPMALSKEWQKLSTS